MIYNSNIEIPQICELQFVESIVDFTRFKNDYIQKLGLTDSRRIQFLSDNDLTDTFYLKCYSYNYDFYLCSFTFTKNTLSTGKYYWDAYYDAPTILAAIQALNIFYIDTSVYFKIETATDVLMTSYPLLIGSFPKTVQLLIHNSVNALNTVFGNFDYSTVFSIRVEGCFAPSMYTPKGEYETFHNQKHEPEVTYSNPYDYQKLTLGGAYGLPDYMIQKLSYFLSTDILLINFVQYVRDGDFSFTENEKRGTRQMFVNLIPKTNRLTQNILGEDIYITNKEENIITDENNNLFTL